MLTIHMGGETMKRLSDCWPCDSDADLKRMLGECGCDAESIERRLARGCDDRIDDLIEMLRGKRRTYMEDLHAAQRRVDRLDYVIRLLKQEKS